LLVDDYAHHPKEINANIEAALVLAKKRNGKLIVIIQPHRYSRVQKLFDSFVDSKLCEIDVLGIMPIYSAGETEIKGISSRALCEKIKENVSMKRGSDAQKSFLAKDLNSFDDMNGFIKSNVFKNDIVIFMGAGDITTMAYDFFNLNNSVGSD
jgi:UDP-N-acetylmuramate--alanine ligase